MSKYNVKNHMVLSIIVDPSILKDLPGLDIPYPSHVEFFDMGRKANISWIIHGYCYSDEIFSRYVELEKLLIESTGGTVSPGANQKYGAFPVYVRHYKEYHNIQHIRKGSNKPINVFYFDQFYDIKKVSKAPINESPRLKKESKVSHYLRNISYRKFREDKEGFTRAWLGEQLLSYTDDWEPHIRTVEKIYEWVIKNYTGRKSKSIHSRRDHAIYLNVTRGEEKFKRFKNYIKFFSLSLDTINKSELGRVLKLSRNTVAAYIRKLLDLELTALTREPIGVKRGFESVLAFCVSLDFKALCVFESFEKSDTLMLFKKIPPEKELSTSTYPKITRSAFSL